ncbi:MAG: methyltransferase domain-containing protein [Longimicrobiales bacterium]
MGDYSKAPELYDLLYQEKDYAGEAAALAEVVKSRCPDAVSVLDVCCGTGEHARHLESLGFTVDGLDIEPSFVEQAGAKGLRGVFHVGDMTDFTLPDRYDAVVCLFSAIGYSKTVEALEKAVGSMAAHLSDGGVLVIEPWFEPGELTSSWINLLGAKSDEVSVARMSRTMVEGTTSRLEFEYLVGTSEGIERRSEVHELGLFTKDQMAGAFLAAGLTVDHLPKSLRNRGLYVGQRSPGLGEAAYLRPSGGLTKLPHDFN